MVLNREGFFDFKCLVTLTINEISPCSQRTNLHWRCIFVRYRMLLRYLCPILYINSIFLLFVRLTSFISFFNLLVNNCYKFYFLYLFYFYVVIINKFWEDLNATKMVGTLVFFIAIFISFFFEIELLFDNIFFFLNFTKAQRFDIQLLSILIQNLRLELEFLIRTNTLSWKTLAQTFLSFVIIAI